MVQGERICVSVDQWPASFMAVLILEELLCVYRTDGVGKDGALRRHKFIAGNSIRKIINKELKQQGS